MSGNDPTARSLHLGGFLKAGGAHLAGWTDPGAPADGSVNIRFISELARELEAAKFDAIFIADLVAVPDSGDAVLQHVSVVNDNLEPITALSAVAAATQRIGLIPTASTTYNHPYTLARALASLDHISGGRAGWNVVTSLIDAEARNFGLDGHLAHEDRYARAGEFVDVVTALWDSFDDDAFVWDRETGAVFEPDRIHWLHHRGERFRVAGPLNIARPPQGRPVLAQAGASESGRQLAARIGELIFAGVSELDEAREFGEDVRRRAAGFGRDPSQILFLPGLHAVVGRTRAEAEDKQAELAARIPDRVLLGDLEYFLGGVDLTGYDLDEPLPELPTTPGQERSGRDRIYARAREHGLTIRQLLEERRSGERSVIGTPQEVADHIQEWFESGAVDGFNISFSHLPANLTDFTRLVVPELQRRGLFRTEYHGSTLREHLGLRRPASSYASKHEEAPA